MQYSTYVVCSTGSIKKAERVLLNLLHFFVGVVDSEDTSWSARILLGFCLGFARILCGFLANEERGERIYVVIWYTRNDCMAENLQKDRCFYSCPLYLCCAGLWVGFFAIVFAFVSFVGEDVA